MRVSIPFFYKMQAIPKGKRNPRDYFVKDVLEVDIPDFPEHGLPKAFRAQVDEDEPARDYYHEPFTDRLFVPSDTESVESWGQGGLLEWQRRQALALAEIEASEGALRITRSERDSAIRGVHHVASNYVTMNGRVFEAATEPFCLLKITHFGSRKQIKLEITNQRHILSRSHSTIKGAYSLNEITDAIADARTLLASMNARYDDDSAYLEIKEAVEDVDVYLPSALQFDGLRARREQASEMFTIFFHAKGFSALPMRTVVCALDAADALMLLQKEYPSAKPLALIPGEVKDLLLEATAQQVAREARAKRAPSPQKPKIPEVWQGAWRTIQNQFVRELSEQIEYQYTAPNGRRFSIRQRDADSPLLLEEHTPNGRVVQIEDGQEHIENNPIIDMLKQNPNAFEAGLVRYGIAPETVIRNGAGYGVGTRLFANLADAAKAIHQALEANTWYSALDADKLKNPSERAERMQQEAALRLSWRSAEAMETKAAEQSTHGLLKGARNLYGPLPKEAQQAILSYLNKPTTEKWNEIAYTSIKGTTSLWSVWCAHDASAPKTKGDAGWPNIPSPETLTAAIRGALDPKPMGLDDQAEQIAQAVLAAESDAGALTDPEHLLRLIRVQALTKGIDASDEMIGLIADKVCDELNELRQALH